MKWLRAWEPPSFDDCAHRRLGLSDSVFKRFTSSINRIELLRSAKLSFVLITSTTSAYGSEVLPLRSTATLVAILDAGGPAPPVVAKTSGWKRFFSTFTIRCSYLPFFEASWCLLLLELVSDRSCRRGWKFWHRRGFDRTLNRNIRLLWSLIYPHLHCSLIYYRRSRLLPAEVSVQFQHRCRRLLGA